MIHVVVVEDSEQLLMKHTKELEDRGLKVMGVASAPECMTILEGPEKVDAVVSDLILGKVNGDALFPRDIHHRWPSLP